MRIFQLGFLRIFEKIISQNHIFFFEEKWLILAGKRGDVSVWSLTSKTEYHICRSYAPHERGTLPQLAADCGCCQNLSHSYPRTWYSRVRSCEQSGFSALNHYNKEAMWNPLTNISSKRASRIRFGILSGFAGVILDANKWKAS